MTAGLTGIVASASAVQVVRDRRSVLQDVSLDLQAGTVTLLIGPNGAGKTTLLRALCGTIALAAGRITVMGRDPRRDRRAREAIGVVPQEIALYPALTARENCEAFAAFAGRPRDRAAIDPILVRTGLSGAGDRRIATLSGGMQRRANIACALVTAPRVLLLDEPTVGLDPEARRAIGADIRRLATEAGVAVLIATHDLDEGEALADAVAVLAGGRLVATGHPADLIGRTFAHDARHVEIALATPPDDLARAALTRRGYVPTADAALWRGFAALADGMSLPGASQLGIGEGGIREMRVRRPGLADVYAALVGAGALAP